jgi:DOPA 4,5-dioxygenase
MGRVHERPVGPHPDWSCQLTVTVPQLGEVLTWLALNRNGLVIFCHPSTGDSLKDHTDHAIWLGAIRPLDLTQFQSPAEPAARN